MSLPLVTAHSGFENTIPNSLENVKKAVEMGVDIVEVDVRHTKDGIAVLNHDNTIIISDLIKVDINKTNFGDIQKILEQNGMQILTTLDEALSYIQSYKQVMNLDIKTHEVINAVIKLIKKYNIEAQIIITGCGENWVRIIKSKYNKLNVLYNPEEEYTMLSMEEAVMQIYNTAIDISCCAINLEYHYINEYIVEFFNKRCLPVFAWTIDDEVDMEKLIKLGVTSITTMRVEKLYNVKRKFV